MSYSYTVLGIVIKHRTNGIYYLVCSVRGALYRTTL